MKHCRLCNRRVWPRISLTSRKLCARCANLVVTDVALRKRRIGRSLAAIEMGTTQAERSRYVEILLREGRKLARYERLGIQTMTPRPSRIVELALQLKYYVQGPEHPRGRGGGSPPEEDPERAGWKPQLS